MLRLRPFSPGDPPLLAAAFAAQGWNKPEAQFARYLEEQQQGQRLGVLVEVDRVIAGYLTVLWVSQYPPFCQAKIPEIVDFNVLKRFQRQGFGTALMHAAESQIIRRSLVAGIGVGLTPDYGPAHILYARRGYIPDGRGIYQGGRWLGYGERLTLDDSAAIYFTRSLSRKEALVGEG